jgi:transcriptional regulator with XRE-family HTH domain
MGQATRPDFGGATKRLREKNGLSQTDLRELIKMEASQISRLETGDSFPRWETIEKLAKAFKMTPLDFIAYAMNHREG